MFREMDPTLQAFNRWHSHFYHLGRMKDVLTDFKAVLLADMETRHSYIGDPFIFDARELTELVAAYRGDLYETENVVNIKKLVQASVNQQLTELQQLNGSSHTAQGSSVCNSFQLPGGFPDLRIAQAGNSRTTSNAICLRCAKQGHTAFDCSSNILPDGKTCFLNRSSKANGAIICRAYNLKGCSAHDCAHDNSWKHICSFCGAASHHALAFHCQKAPGSD
jgi:hypothetical protein